MSELTEKDISNVVVQTNGCLTKNTIFFRYHYVVYVLNTLFPDRPFGPCNYNDETKKLKNPIVGGECYVVPLRQITCTSDFDIALMGAK